MRKLIMMTGWIFLFGLFAALAAPIPFAISQPSSPSDQSQVLGDARLSLIQGDVAIQTQDTGSEWGAAAINTPLIPGTKIWDPETGRSEIQFLNGSYLRASENTEVDITNLSMRSNGDAIQVGVPLGRSYINYAGSKARNSVFQVDTPITSVMAYGPSKFEVEVYNDGATEVSVLRGSVSVQGQNGETQVDAGTMLSMDSNQNVDLSSMRPEDAWISWNLSRDSRVARGDSRRYLPASLNGYDNDFDTYGRWVSTADYGYVWVPTGVAVDWAPYRVGRWCWIGGDYVWISYEPWGWAPYHYGRWAFIRTTGWCWVPPVAAAAYWGPGFVAWIDTPTYVSWVPLAPREIYYGHGYYGPNSVNITNVNISRINMNNVYVNAKVANAVTVVNRRTFITGKPERVMGAPRNPFTAGIRPSIGRPDIKPERATAFPNPVKVVAEKKLPSREIITRAEKIRNRPIAVQKDISVFKPGERTTSMHVNRIERPKPITSVQKPEPGKLPVQREETGKAPTQRREVVPQREFGIAPSHQGELKSSPPVGREEINRPSPPSTAAPQKTPQRPQSVAPKKEQVTPPSAQRREVGPPPAQREQPRGPSTQREFGVAPQHQGQLGTPPAQSRPQAAPSGQMSRPTPPATRPQSSPPAQITRPMPSAPKTSSEPSVQRNMGVAPPHTGQPTARPAQRTPQAAPSGSFQAGMKDKAKR